MRCTRETGRSSSATPIVNVNNAPSFPPAQALGEALTRKRKRRRRGREAFFALGGVEMRDERRLETKTVFTRPLAFGIRAARWRRQGKEKKKLHVPKKVLKTEGCQVEEE